ncbi:MAG: DUF1573 domain-containing protein [Lentimicrobiaceae bacterium]|nr:DUF1573 domain-containing protein [Lentimicrobiaceae bacterium]
MNLLSIYSNLLRHNRLAYYAVTFCILLWSCGNNGKSRLLVSDIENQYATNEIEEEQEMTIPEILFENLSHDFGKVIQGEELSFTFSFQNVGKSNLLIYSAQPSCGCTSVIPSKEPINPGGKGEITIIFDSKEKSGEIINHLVVTANTYPAQTVLTISANVVSP